MAIARRKIIMPARGRFLFFANDNEVRMNPIKIEAKLFASIRQAREYNRIAIGAKKCGLKFNRAYALQLRDDAIYKARICLDYLI